MGKEIRVKEPLSMGNISNLVVGIVSMLLIFSIIKCNYFSVAVFELK